MIYLKTSVGIELRGEDMLISSLQSNLSAGVFTHFVRIPEWRLRHSDDVRREINVFFKMNGLGKENIVLGLPRKDLVLRYLDLPAEVIDNLKQVVQYQVQSYEPTEEDRYYHDYVLLQNNGLGKRLSVMLVMVRKALLDEILQSLLNLGIRPVAVTGGSIGLSNLFLRSQKDLQDKIFILGDMGTSSLETVALRNGSIVYSREAPKPESETGWKDLILRETGEASSKIRLGPESSLEKLVLAGESSETAFLELRGDFPDCEMVQNCIGLQVPGENKYLVQEAATGLGLAYSGTVRKPAIKVNLLPQERRVHQSRWAYVPTVILGLVVIALFCALGFHRVAQNRVLNRRLERELLALKAPVERVQTYRRQAEELEKRVKSIEELMSRKDMNLEVIRELTTILPADTYLNSYKYQDGTIQILGRSGSASDLLPKLEKSPLLKDVVAKGNIYKDAQTGKEVFSFDAKLER